MAEPFMAEVRIFGFTRVMPTGWALCDGSRLSITQNTQMFSLISTIYGGDGLQWFNLPNIQDRVVVGAGQGPGLSAYPMGFIWGSDTVTLTNDTMPTHNHPLNVVGPVGDTNLPGGSTPASVIGATPYNKSVPATVPMSPNAITPQGGGGAHNNLQPYLVLQFAIALKGIFPPRTS